MPDADNPIGHGEESVGMLRSCIPLLTLLVVVACSDVTGNATTSVEAAPSSTAPTVVETTTIGPPTSAVATTVADDSAQSVLQRRDVPPQAVAGQFELSMGGNGGGEICPGPFPPGPHVVTEDNRSRLIRVEAGLYPLSLCLPGFDPAETIRIELISPSGDRTVEEIPARDRRADEFDPAVLVENTFEWFPFPTAELGRYTVTATQDNLEASATLVVILPAFPVGDVEPHAGPPGASFIVGLAGFEPESEFPLHIYWADPDDVEVEILEYRGSSFYYGRYQYITSLQVIADDLGRASLDLITEGSDPVGGYCLFARSPPAADSYCDASFELVSPG